jgi:uncharacterized RDD family membrane protein YckC
VIDPLTGVVPRRLLQAVVDRALIGAVFLVLLIAALVGGGAMVRHGRPLWLAEAPAAVAVLAMIGMSAWIEVWWPARRGGATPGMRLLDLRIVTTAGGEPALGAYAARWLLDVVDGALFGLVGVVLIVVTPRHQRLGDLVAGTLVVRLSALSAPAGSATPR